MKALVGAATIAGALVFAQAAYAQQRIGDGVMGALAGGLVAGPVGLIAGGAVGYAEGPHIAHRIFHTRYWYHHHYYNRRLHRWVWR